LETLIIKPPAASALKYEHIYRPFEKLPSSLLFWHVPMLQTAELQRFGLMSMT
jgi:hypothetical protein